MNKKQFFYWLFSFLTISGQISAADLIEILPVTNKILRLTFDDGYVSNRGTGNDVTMSWPLDLEDAMLLNSYQITSPSDPNYAQGLAPSEMGRKSKIHDISNKCEWNGEKCLNEYIQYHYIYLILPYAMVSGETYSLNVANLADNLDKYTFTFDEKALRSVAIHTNQLGYSPASGKKYAYVSQWLGTLGSLEIDSYAGKRFDIYPVNADGSPGASVFNGNLSLQKDLQSGGPDSDKNDVGPDKNFVKSDVWECDFSSFNIPGEYILVIEDIGRSYPFRMHLDSYFEAFYYAARAVYFERAIIALPAQFAGIYERPEWTDRNMVYTAVRTMDLTDESGRNQKQRIYDSIDYAFDVSNMRGWYHDAGDWDGYFSHFRVPRSLMISYELAPDNFTDGELNIPEAQELNGNGGTNIPDILDEAVWLVDYFKQNIGPTGGIFGSRVSPDISDADGLSNVAYHEGQGFVFEDDEVDVNESWNDYRTWIVHGEDPRDSYAFASIAAQYAYNLKIAATKTGEDYTSIISEYENAAKDAYIWANANTLADDEDVNHFVENRAAAAAWLYKLTGTQEYLDQLKTDLQAKNITASTNNLGESKWAVWAYVTIDDTDPLYAGTFDAALKTDLTQAVESDAFQKVTQSIEEKNRSMRMGGNFTQPVWNGQATTPWIIPAMVAYNITGTQSYLDNCFVTADYFLGGNQMNYVWLTLVGHQHPIRILHKDTELDGIYGSLPGVPPYSPRTRCDWMAFQGNRCDYQGPWDNDFYLLDGRIFPAYADDNGQTQWPVHELWFDQYPSPAGAEFTIHQNIAPAAAAYGFLTSSGETLDKNMAPTVVVSVLSASLVAGESVDLVVNANDTDGRIYQTEIYQNHRMVSTFSGNPGTVDLVFSEPGDQEIFVRVSDNLGLFTFSDTLTINVSASDQTPEVNFDMGGEEIDVLLGSSVDLKVTATGSDKVEFYFFFEKIGEVSADPYQLEWTPGQAGVLKIRAVATNNVSGLKDEAVLMVNVSSQLSLKNLWVTPGNIQPSFDPKVYDYEVRMFSTANNAPDIYYDSIKGTVISLMLPAGIDQRMLPEADDRTATIRVEEEGDPSNFIEYKVVFALNTGAPVKMDTILYENFGDEDSGFTGLASEYTKFSSAPVADFTDDSVAINEWWQVSPTDQGASGEAKFWATNLSDEGDTLTFTNIDISGYEQISNISFWCFANTGWSGYSTKSPMVEIAIDGGAYNKLYNPANMEPGQFNAQSQWGYFSLPIDIPLTGSEMNFRIGTYDDQQWMIDDILLLSTGSEECYHTLQSLGVENAEINYDPDELVYEIEVDDQQVPAVSYVPTNAEAEVSVKQASSVNQVTHPNVADRTTEITVANWCGTTTYKIVFTTSDVVNIRNTRLPSLKIYPNPADDLVIVKHTEPMTRLQLIDAAGNTVKDIEVNDRNEVVLDIDELPAGFYIIKTSHNGELNGTGRLTK